LAEEIYYIETYRTSIHTTARANSKGYVMLYVVYLQENVVWSAVARETTPQQQESRLLNLQIYIASQSSIMTNLAMKCTAYSGDTKTKMKKKNGANKRDRAHPL
jgi:hypothetical protein